MRFFLDKIILHGYYLILLKKFSRINVHRFLRFYIKSGANIEKSSIISYNVLRNQIVQEYQWMICRILSKKRKFAMKKDSIFCHSFIYKNAYRKDDNGYY